MCLRPADYFGGCTSELLTRVASGEWHRGWGGVGVQSFHSVLSSYQVFLGEETNEKKSVYLRNLKPMQ